MINAKKLEKEEERIGWKVFFRSRVTGLLHSPFYGGAQGYLEEEVYLAQDADFVPSPNPCNIGFHAFLSFADADRYMERTLPRSLGYVTRKVKLFEVGWEGNDLDDFGPPTMTGKRMQILKEGE